MARVPLVYPKIPGAKDAPPARCIAFEKYDGSNLHWMWDAEAGWTSFGTRRDSFPLDGAGISEFHRAHPGLEEAPELFRRDLADPLEAVIRRHARYRSGGTVTLFTEFFGPRSFAGMHRERDSKELILFDVRVDQEFLAPEEFVENWRAVKVAREVYRGKLTGQFTEDVRNGKYDVAEGVVCKGTDSSGSVFRVKIKTRAYMEKLKQAFKDRWEDYWE